MHVDSPTITILQSKRWGHGIELKVATRSAQIVYGSFLEGQVGWFSA